MKKREQKPPPSGMAYPLGVVAGNVKDASFELAQHLALRGSRRRERNIHQWRDRAVRLARADRHQHEAPRGSPSLW